MNCRIIAFSLSLILSWMTASGSQHTGNLSYSNDVSYGFDALALNDATGWRAYSDLSWTVSDEEAGAPAGFDWLYSYTIDTEKFAPVRWVIETGAGFTLDNIDPDTIQVAQEGTAIAYDPAVKLSFGTFESTGDSGDRRDMPGTRYGMFFDDTGAGGNNTTITTVTFWSDVAPAWGDLYANCGGNGNRGWNSGFTTLNPTDAASDGTILNHVLTPGVIPEPASAIMIGFGTGLIALIRRFYSRT